MPAHRAPAAERTAPFMSYAGASAGRRSAAWTAVAFVLSRYGGATVENHSDRRVTPSGATARAVRAAATPMVVASSSYPATVRVPLPPPVPATARISVRSRRR